jgi:hypothetical protein
LEARWRKKHPAGGAAGMDAANERNAIMVADLEVNEGTSYRGGNQYQQVCLNQQVKQYY